MNCNLLLACQCSVAGSTVTACHEVTGRCHCKSNAEGLKCNSCKPGTFNLDAANQHGCLHCFGYGRSINCTSAHGFVASVIRSQFVNKTGLSNTLASWHACFIKLMLQSVSLMLTITRTPSKEWQMKFWTRLCKSWLTLIPD